MKKFIHTIALIVLALPVLGQSKNSTTEKFSSSIQLHSFFGTAQENSIELEWAIEWEKEFDNLTVERAGNDMAFKVIGRVKGKGQTDEQVVYDFVDNFPLEGQNYYRLKITGLDGNVEYYPIISTYFDGLDSNNIDTYPNVVTEHYLKLASESLVREIRILDLNGKIVYSHVAQININEIHLPKEIKKGSYLLILLNCHGAQYQQKIMIL